MCVFVLVNIWSYLFIKFWSIMTTLPLLPRASFKLWYPIHPIGNIVILGLREHFFQWKKCTYLFSSSFSFFGAWPWVYGPQNLQNPCIMNVDVVNESSFSTTTKGTTCATTCSYGKLWLVKGWWWVYVGTSLHQP